MDLTRIITTNFTNEQLWTIVAAFALGLASFILFTSRRTGWSLFFLFASGLVLRLFAAGLDPFLNTWDEQFHALVAKNMMNHPTTPMLNAEPLLDYDYKNWGGNHIWLHKQPWFLWQIALFMKIFGVSEFVVRLPSVIMLSLLTFIIFRIGKLISTEKVAWFGAFLYTYSMIFVMLVSGQYFTDHNDAAFIFYIALSIWAWLEYSRTGLWKWILLVGLFAGIAVLNKWLVGLLIYSGWFVSAFAQKGMPAKWRELKRMGLALLVTVAVALPWQVHIMTVFPTESGYEYAYNTEHFYKALEGHGGDFWYHFLFSAWQYGSQLVLFVIIPGLFLLFRDMKKLHERAAMITVVAVTYGFFTMAATKMPLFTVIVLPIIFLALAKVLVLVIETVAGRLPAKVVPFLLVPLLFYMSYSNMAIHEPDLWHTDNYAMWRQMRINAISSKEMAKRLPSDDYVVFNAGPYHAVSVMFYTGHTTYGFYPNGEQVQKLKEMKRGIAVFADKDLPRYLRNDPEVLKVYYPLFRY
jgi:4-amino-4-deoxy-L-arabinose transferase